MIARVGRFACVDCAGLRPRTTGQPHKSGHTTMRRPPACEFILRTAAILISPGAARAQNISGCAWPIELSRLPHEGGGRMKGVKSLALRSLAALALANLEVVDVQAQEAPQPEAQAKREADGGARHGVEPQAAVVCTGWHALCSASFDCRMNGDEASCDCLRVNETHIVLTAEIQDAAVKRLTETQCTNERPCDVDEAPVCSAIKYGRYEVDHVSYQWVSTYSYRGWCDLLKRNLTACDQHANGFTGDPYWAVCDGAPCTESQNPSDPERPLTCQCRVEDTPYVGANARCTGENGGIISSFPVSAWDFENNTYRIPMPGYEYVQGACAPPKSDPWTEPSLGPGRAR